MLNKLITSLTRHRVSADVIMLIFIMSGIWAIAKLTVRFFPPFEVNIIVATVVMPGSSTTETEETIVVPMENALRNVTGFDKMLSYSRENSGTVLLEFPDDVNLDKALEDVKAEIDRVSLPTDAESPIVNLSEFNTLVSRLTLVGPKASELRDIARRLENDLNAQGIAKVEVEGLPEEEIEVLVDQRKLIELNMSLTQVGLAIRGQNSNASVGSLSGLGNERKLRADSKSAELAKLAEIPISSTADGDIVHLRDIARLRRTVTKKQVTLEYNGLPAVMMVIYSTGTENMLEVAEQLNAWVAKQNEALPPSVRLVTHDEEWRNVESRLNLLLNNGATGMLLVLAVLFTFLSLRVALWVAAGIPVAMLGTLFAFQLAGGTINMISMFALIMAIGIIVDDAIVVGENAQYRFSRGDPPMRAVTSAARKMFTPVLASSFTTIAAFLPLFLIRGPIGSIIYDIPLIIVCILIAAMLECFFVLPGHLYRSFAKRKIGSSSMVRDFVDRGFDTFRERYFRPFVTFAVRHATATTTSCIMLLVISFSLLSNGFVNYRFFPGAEGNRMFANISFSSGTPRKTVEDFVADMIEALNAADAQINPDKQLVQHVSAFAGKGDVDDPASQQADHNAHILVELVDVNERNILIEEFTEVWRSNINEVPGIERLEVRGDSSGPPGRDIEIQLTSQNINHVKQVVEEVKEVLRNIPGVNSVNDDTPFGKEEVIFELTPLGRSLNMDVAEVADQLGNALDGFEVQTFTEGVDETDLLVKMDNFDSDTLTTLYLRLPSGDFAPLREIVTWRTEQGFDQILHQHGLPSIVVTADLDPDAPTTVGAVLAEMENKVLERIFKEQGITYSFEGKTADEQQTAEDMLTGLVLAVILIFIILTWVFNSWSMPLVVMLTMPMGVIGTIFGHFIMNVPMSILSFFGMFTLMGILVNNSIVLVDCFRDLGAKVEDEENYNAQIVEAACLRLRAVTLTSLTTIGGLMPLLFETSLQAKFLQPMVISISYGLAFASVLILVFTPACMSIHGALQRSLNKRIDFAKPFRRLIHKS